MGGTLPAKCFLGWGNVKRPKGATGIRFEAKNYIK